MIQFSIPYPKCLLGQVFEISDFSEFGNICIYTVRYLGLGLMSKQEIYLHLYTP
jgi:hypothetical protein